MNKLTKLIAVLLAVMLMFTGCAFGKDNEENTTTTTENNQDSVIIDDDLLFDDGWVDTSDEGTTASSDESDITKKEENSTKPTETTTKAESKGPSTTAEIVEYFNKSANKVKTDATKVVKNYEDRTVGEVEVPQILQSTLEGLMETSMKDDTDPVTYATKEEIRENFLVPEQDYVSRLTVDSVESAEIRDKGNEYVIRIELKDQTNPTAGSGVGAVFDVIEAKEVAESGMVEDFTTEYYDCVVIATIDKATGRMTHANYTTPLILNVTVNMFGTHNGKVNLTFEKDYTITY